MDVTGRGVAGAVTYRAAGYQILQVILFVVKMLIRLVVTLEGPFVGFLFRVVFAYIPVTHAARVIVALQHDFLYLLEFFGRYVSGVSSVFRVVLIRFVRHVFKVIFTLFILINYT